MNATIPTYAKYGLDAIPAAVIVQEAIVHLVERGIGKTPMKSSRDRIAVRKQACKNTVQTLGDGNWLQRQ